MSLGTALLRPQALADPPPAQPVDAMDAARDLVVGLARDLASGGAGWAIIEAELTAGVEQLHALIEPHVDAAAAHLSALLDPVVAAVLLDALVGGVPAPSPEPCRLCSRRSSRICWTESSTSWRATSA